MVGVGCLLLLAFCLYFFRNPKRSPQGDEQQIVSPADGRVLEISEVQEERFLNEKMQRISIFMSPLNVHVNRMPITGRVETVSYNRGKFFPAFSEKASLDNEQNAIVIKNDRGVYCLFIQIAGWLARRIVCHATVGESWRRGDVFGMIRFGSRVDVYLPCHYLVKVGKDQRVCAGETILAEVVSR